MSRRANQRWIGVLQPVYLPWLGYFEQMDRVDHFIFQDDVQYTTRDWRNRNRIKSREGPVWLTVPVRKASLDTRICDIEINYQTPWPQKHLKAIELNYARAPGLDVVEKTLGGAFDARPARLADLTIALAEALAARFSIEVETSRSSAVPREAEGDLDNRLIELARAHEATHVYYGASSAAYVEPERFRPYGIEVVFQDYRHPEYPQQFAGFASHMSAIDLLMNAPDEAREILLSGAV